CSRTSRTHLARNWGSIFFGMLSILPDSNSNGIKPGPIHFTPPIHSALVSVPARSLSTCRTAHKTDRSESQMRVAAYHSINPTDPDVHHIHVDCPSGQQIPLANRRSGTNRWPLCKHCRSK